MHRILILILIVVLVACRKSASPSAPAPAASEAHAPSCREIYDLQVERYLAATAEARRAEAKVRYDEMKVTAIANCEEKAFSADLRTCLHAVMREQSPRDQYALNVALATCHRSDLIAHGHDMNGPSCDDVLAHLISVAPAVPEGEARAQFAPACNAFTRGTKECMLAVTTPDAALKCTELTPL